MTKNSKKENFYWGFPTGNISTGHEGSQHDRMSLQRSSLLTTLSRTITRDSSSKDGNADFGVSDVSSCVVDSHSSFVEIDIAVHPTRSTHGQDHANSQIMSARRICIQCIGASGENVRSELWNHLPGNHAQKICITQRFPLIIQCTHDGMPVNFPNENGSVALSFSVVKKHLSTQPLNLVQKNEITLNEICSCFIWVHQCHFFQVCT